MDKEALLALWNSVPLTVRDPSLSLTRILRATKIRHVLQSTIIHSHSASVTV